MPVIPEDDYEPSSKKAPGRPTKCTPELTAAMAETLELGHYVETACRLHGISDAAYYKWIKRGRDELDRVEANPRARVRQDEAPFVAFVEATTRALAEAEHKALTVIRTEALLSADVALRYLERRYPDRWGKRTHEVTIDGKARVHVFLPTEEADDE